MSRMHYLSDRAGLIVALSLTLLLWGAAALVIFAATR